MDLLGVSGGIDSMCLAGTYLGDGRPFGIAHCNFCLRGEESDGDEAFVRDWAEAHGVPCHVARFDTRAYAAEHGISIEMAARELRYRFFAETAVAHGYDAVAVAHNANDNAETLLLNLLRGTGLRGVCGMKAVSTLPLPGCTIPLLRPLLGMTRDEIAARMAGLPYREDHTNAENEVKRNKLRNIVFPVFKEINPSFVETLARDMARFADSQAIVDAYLSEHPEEAGGVAGRAANGIAVRADDGTVDKAGGFDAPMPEKPVRYTITEESWDGSQSVLQPAGTLILDADRLPGAAGLYVKGPSEESTHLAANGYATEMAEGKAPEMSEESDVVAPEEYNMAAPGEYNMAAPENNISAVSLLEECFWTPGDWIRPLGAGGRKKLQDWFTDRHIPIPLKHATPLLRAVQPSGGDSTRDTRFLSGDDAIRSSRHPFVDDTTHDTRHPSSNNVTPNSRHPATDPHHILVIVGHTIDDSLRVTASTRRILRITVLP